MSCDHHIETPAYSVLNRFAVYPVGKGQKVIGAREDEAFIHKFKVVDNSVVERLILEDEGGVTKG